MLSSGDLINTRICIAVMRQYRCNFLTLSPVIFTATFPKYHITQQSRNPIPPFRSTDRSQRSQGMRRGGKKTYKKKKVFTR